MPQAIIAFFLILHFRRRLRTFSPNAWWDRVLQLALYGVIALAIGASIFHMDVLAKWILHLLLLALIGLAYKEPSFFSTRPAVIAVAPAVILSFLTDVLEAAAPHLYLSVKTYFDVIAAIAITWMVAMLILSDRQQKALIKERQKAAEEAEKNKINAARKAELEALVKERTIELTQQKETLQHALTDLKATQAQLVQSEKMASLGELTAGIAHEIQNPLNFINNFSDVNAELIAEMKAGIETGNLDEIKILAGDIEANEQKIMYHGKRADAIVKNMLQHSRKNVGEKQPTSLNALADEYLRLSYHGLRAKDKSFNAKIETHFDESVGKVSIVPQDIGRVLLNLFNNAFYAVNEKKKQEPAGYAPTVSVTTKRFADKIEIKVSDNGMGISKSAIEKIFQPFFTTKPTGEGTGLGLSMSYDIIKAHGGEINVESEEGNGTCFTINLPA